MNLLKKSLIALIHPFTVCTIVTVCAVGLGLKYNYSILLADAGVVCILLSVVAWKFQNAYFPLVVKDLLKNKNELYSESKKLLEHYESNIAKLIKKEEEREEKFTKFESAIELVKANLMKADDNYRLEVFSNLIPAMADMLNALSAVQGSQITETNKKLKEVITLFENIFELQAEQEKLNTKIRNIEITVLIYGTILWGFGERILGLFNT